MEMPEARAGQAEAELAVVEVVREPRGHLSFKQPTSLGALGALAQRQYPVG